MTCKERYQQRFGRTDYNAYCPSDFWDIYNPAEDSDENGCDRTCEECWSRECPGEEGVNDMNPNEGAPNMVHAYVPKSTTVRLDDIRKAGEAAKKASESIGMSTEAITAMNQILDSGDRTEFETGAVRDMREGKGRCDLMPLDVVAEYFRRGMYAPDPKRAEDYYFIVKNISDFKRTDYTRTDFLYQAFAVFDGRFYDYTPTMFLEVAKHFEEGAKKYGENNWQKGIPPKCYIDSAMRHFLKLTRGDNDEPHDRAFVWNLMCCIWEVDYRGKEGK